MITRAYLSHIAMGRVRLKIPAKRGNKEYFQALETALAAHSDIDAVQANPRTGSVLILHSGSLDLAALAQQAEEQSWFQLETLVPISESLHSLAKRQLDWIDALLRRSSGSRLDNSSLIFLTLAFLAGRQIANGQIAPPAVTVLWYLYELLQSSERR